MTEEPVPKEASTDLESSSTDANERACLTVLSSVGKQPQGPFGRYLIAETVLETLDGHQKGRKLTISELASINPDPIEMADKINQIHRQFGVKREATPAEANSRVCEYAVVTLDNIRQIAEMTADDNNISFPDNLRTPIEINPDGEDFFSPKRIDKSRAKDLEDTLLSDPHLRRLVSEKIRVRADNARRTSAENQKAASEGNPF